MIKIYRLILLICFFFLLFRLGQLTIIQGKDFRSQAEQNRIIKEKLVAARGTIFDRNGKILATDVPYCLYQGKEQDREECLRLKSSGEEVEQLFRRYYPLGQAAGHISGYLGQANCKKKNLCKGRRNNQEKRRKSAIPNKSFKCPDNKIKQRRKKKTQNKSNKRRKTKIRKRNKK